MTQKAQPPYDHIVFDVESTLVAIEGMDFLAEKKGVGEEVAALTKDAMEGSMPFSESFRKRIEILRPTLSEVRELGKIYIEHCVDDAPSVLKALEFLEKKIYLISGGFWRTVGVVADTCGIPRSHTFACRLSFHGDGTYNDYDHGSFVFSTDGKRAPLQNLFGTKAYIGDAATDAAVYDDVQLLIGFTGVAERSALIQRADIVITTKSIAPVLMHILSEEEQNLLLGQRKHKVVIEKARTLSAAGNV